MEHLEANKSDSSNQAANKQDPFEDQDLPLAMQEAVAKSKLHWVTDSNGVQIPVRAFGEGHHRTPVVLAHGLQSHSGWFVQSGAFVDQCGFPLYALDRRGSGLSKEPHGDAKSYEEWSEDILTVAKWAINRHSTERVHVMGHCFGAIPAAVFACEHAEKVQSLILPTPGIYTHTDLKLGQKLYILWSKLTGTPHDIPVPLATELFSDLPEYQRFIEQDDLKLQFATSSLYWEVPKARRYIAKAEKELTVPTLMVLAGHDRVCDNAANRTFFNDLGSTEKNLIEYDDAVHIIEFSHERESFFSDLQSWLSAHP